MIVEFSAFNLIKYELKEGEGGGVKSITQMSSVHNGETRCFDRTVYTRDVQLRA